MYHFRTLESIQLSITWIIGGLIMRGLKQQQWYQSLNPNTIGLHVLKIILTYMWCVLQRKLISESASHPNPYNCPWVWTSEPSDIQANEPWLIVLTTKPCDGSMIWNLPTILSYPEYIFIQWTTKLTWSWSNNQIRTKLPWLI